MGSSSGKFKIEECPPATVNESEQFILKIRRSDDDGKMDVDSVDSFSFDSGTGCSCTGSNRGNKDKFNWGDDEVGVREYYFTCSKDKSLSNRDIVINYHTTKGSKEGSTECPVTVSNVETVGKSGFTSTSDTIAETAKQMVLNISRNIDNAGTLNVNLYLSSSQMAGINLSKSSFSWAAGNSDTKSTTVSWTNDSVYQVGKQFTVSTNDGASVEVSVTNDEDIKCGQVVFTSTSATVNENVGSKKFIVSRTGGSDKEFSVNLRQLAAMSGYSDQFQSISPSTLTWSHGNSSNKEVTLTFKTDSSFIYKQQARAELYNAVCYGGSLIGSNSGATVTIKDDDGELS
eukprot:TRINITY_DN5239_c0_g1_i7.p1 TRINITY_DN5239_c0_g1~~TRINITY_DN5239_c0_g1_i7.p1  ORF type:complete len:344 (+),score=64.75 TRINITY_DN5239_c0_g1_i7:164-1195(+)